MLQEYQVVGRKLPGGESNQDPKLYKMRLFAPNTVVAKSRFFYFMNKLKKIKRSTGEIVSLTELKEAKPMTPKNLGIWLRYNSRSGTHNMYKEYRELSRAEAVTACYQDMAARHRARFPSIHIMRVAEVPDDQVRRPYIKQLLKQNLRFPLPHQSAHSYRPIFVGKKPGTY